MLSHITTDLQQVYLEEVFTPQLGKPGASTPAKPKSSSDLDGDGNVDSFEKKVRQLIYDVRHIMKAKKVPAEKAFQMRSSKTNYGAEIVKAAKEKLGIRGGSATSVSEEILSEDDKVGIVVNYKNGTTYRKSVSRDSVQTELQKFRSNPNVSSVEQTRYGLTKMDRDGDGKIESPSKEHAGVVHNAIQRATGGTPDGKDTRGKKKTSSKKKLKTYGVSEGFSNWREDLKEVAGVDDEIASRNKKQIKENPKLDNYKNKVIVINPEFKEEIQILGGTIVEAFELNEEYINESVNIATEFFYNYGLNENGVDIVIEELGEEKFTEFVFDLSEEYFLSKEISRKIKEEIDPKTFAGKKVTADKTRKLVESAKETQELSSEPKKQSIKAIVGEAVYGDKIYKSADHLQEKAESEQQQKLFGLALSVKRGDTPRSEASAEVLKIVDTMSEKKIRDFASTSHSEVPQKKVTEAIANPEGVTDQKPPRVTQRQKDTVDKHVKNKQRQYGSIGEDMAPTTPKQISARNLELRAEKMRVAADQQAMQQQKKKIQNKRETVDETSTSTKMSLEDYMMVKKDGSRVRMPGDPPKVKREPGGYDYTPTPEQQAAMRKPPKTKIGSRFD